MLKKKEETTFGHNLKKYLKAYNEKTGIHGLHYLTEERSKLEKLVWAVFLLISLTCCFLMIYGILMKFEKNPVVMSFATKYTPIYEIPFPSVTICPEVKFMHTYFNYTDVYLQFISENGRISEELWHKFLYFALICNEDDERVLRSGSEAVGEDFFEILENALPYILADCKFMGEEYKNCKGILTPVITDLGICYSFNILDRSEVYRDHVVLHDFHRVANYGQTHFKEFAYTEEAGLHSHPRRALYSGASNSFDVLLVENLNDSDYICTKFYEGYRISFHNPVDIPRLSKHYFRLPVDRTMVAALKPEKIVTSAHVKYLAPDKRQCYWMNERYLRHFKIYTQSNCMLECLTNFTLRNCGCVDFYMPRDNKTQICGIRKKFCLKEAEMRLQTNDFNLKISRKHKDGEYYCDCKPACTEINFSVEMSHSQLFYTKYIDAVNHGVYVVDDKLRFSSLSVYVKDQQFMSLERNELYGISDLISDFGGLLGLFTGFSLISLIEIIYCLTLRIYYNKKLYGSWAGPDRV